MKNDQGLDFPNGIGHWAFWGHKPNRELREVIHVTDYHAGDGNLAQAIQINGSLFWTTQSDIVWPGKWYRMAMPWECSSNEKEGQK